MSAFSLTPALDDHAYDGRCPSFRRLLATDFTDDDGIAWQVERFQREHGMVGGIIPRKDVFAVDLDVQGYKPEDLHLCVEDNTLTISGTHGKKNKDGNY